MPSCYICKKSNECYEMKELNCRLHLFPAKQPFRVEKWIEFARVPKGVDISKLYLCTKHFADEAVRRHPFYVMLQKEAIPTLFPPTVEGHIPAPKKQKGPSTNNCVNPELVLVDSGVSWDPGSPEPSSCVDPLKCEEAEPSYDEELLKTVKEQLCRVCGMKRDNLLPMSSEAETSEGDVLTLIKKIELYLSLEIDKDDGLPTNICSDCYTQVESWHELHTSSVAADSILKKMFAVEKKEIPPPVDIQETRTKKENVPDEQVQDNDCIKKECDSELVENINIQKRSSKVLDNADKEDDVILYLQKSSDLIELEIREFLKRIQGKLGRELENKIVEKQQNQPDPIRNDHMYARDQQPPSTACKFCRQVVKCRVLGRDTVIRGDKLSCVCDNKKTVDHKVVDVFREVLGKIEEKIVKEHKATQPDVLQNDTIRVKKILPPVYTCVHCQQTFFHKGTGVLHKKQCALESAMCEICGRILKTRKDLKEHKSRHSHGPSSSSICEKCGKIFATRAGLQIHIRNVHTEGTFVCEPCCKVFANSARHGVHMRRHEKGRVESLNLRIADCGEEGIFTCPVCGAQFQDKTSVIVHMNERLKIRCVKCKGWILSERLSLTHKCSFTTCRFCSKRFLRTGGKYAHERLHTGEKPYACKECGKAFASCGALINHRVTHKPPEHKCEICNKWFLRKTVYMDHMASHAGVKYPCIFCPNIYNSRRALNKHNGKKHREEMSAGHVEEYILIKSII